MELFPELRLDWLNGWIFVVISYLILGLLILSCPREVIARLYDEKGWTKSQKILAKISKIFALLNLILMIFTPINFLSIDFIIGSVIFSLGTVGFIIAIFNFKNAPLDKPITLGIYKISRNPQQLMLYLVTLGSSILIGSGIAIISFVFYAIFSHFRILGEERKLLEQYGESYKEYKNKVLRYFLFF